MSDPFRFRFRGISSGIGRGFVLGVVYYPNNRSGAGRALHLHLGFWCASWF